MLKAISHSCDEASSFSKRLYVDLAMDAWNNPSIPAHNTIPKNVLTSLTFACLGIFAIVAVFLNLGLVHPCSLVDHRILYLVIAN